MWKFLLSRSRKSTTNSTNAKSFKQVLGVTTPTESFYLSSNSQRPLTPLQSSLPSSSLCLNDNSIINNRTVIAAAATAAVIFTTTSASTYIAKMDNSHQGHDERNMNGKKSSGTNDLLSTTREKDDWVYFFRNQHETASTSSSSSSSSSWNKPIWNTLRNIMLSNNGYDSENHVKCEEEPSHPTSSPSLPSVDSSINLSTDSSLPDVTFRQRRLTCAKEEKANTKEGSKGENEKEIEQTRPELQQRPTDTVSEAAKEMSSKQLQKRLQKEAIYKRNRMKVLHAAEFEKEDNFSASLVFQQQQQQHQDKQNSTMNPLTDLKPPFPPHQVGTYSCHGLEPHPYLIESSRNDHNHGQDYNDFSSTTSSFFDILFGNRDSNEDHRQLQQHEYIQIATQKINQDRGHVVYPYAGCTRTALFATYDGHGERGEMVAEYAMSCFEDESAIDKKMHFDSATSSSTEKVAAHSDEGASCEYHFNNYLQKGLLDIGDEDSNYVDNHTHQQNQKQEVEGWLSKAPSTSIDLHKMRQLFEQTFQSIDESVKRQYDMHPLNSGSTACIVLLRDKTLWVANVGDSRAVLARRCVFKHLDTDGNNEGIKKHGTSYVDKDISDDEHESNEGDVKMELSLSAIDLTKDQTGNDPEEQERIVKAGGFVTMPLDEGLPARVWLDSSCTQIGLAMTRSIGDFALKQAGVIVDPVVGEYELQDGDEFIIIATDGVWEFISSLEAVQIVQQCFEKGLGASEACKELIRVAMNKWKEEEGDYRDDITAIVVRVDGIWDNCPNDNDSFVKHNGIA